MSAQTAATWPRVRLLGDRAVTIEFGDAIDAGIHARVMGFAAELDHARGHDALPGVLEWVPTFTAVTVHFDDSVDDAAAEGRALLRLATDAGAHAQQGVRWRIPVCFEGDCAPDLDALAQARGLSPEQVVALMCDAEFRVYMLGFQPGFPYLGGLPAECEVPRLASPRRAVPARSLAVAGRMCAVYPWESPGGWHLLGRTPVRPFELAHHQRPALFAPGDIVRWEAIDRARFDELDAQAEAGQLERTRFIDTAEAHP